MPIPGEFRASDAAPPPPADGARAGNGRPHDFCRLFEKFGVVFGTVAAGEALAE